ncbi:MAG: hypothetical protein ABIQ58_03735 [Candidatus Limnocylindrales bacterium]
MPVRTRLTGVASVTAIALLLAACGGGEADGGGAAVSARPPQAQIAVTSVDAATPFELQAGRYKFGWDASECSSVAFTLTGAAQGFVFEKKTLQKKFSSIISGVPADTYTLSQNEAGCVNWTVQLDRVGN